jgi:hypothetical protein
LIAAEQRAGLRLQVAQTEVSRIRAEADATIWRMKVAARTELAATIADLESRVEQETKETAAAELATTRTQIEHLRDLPDDRIDELARRILKYLSNADSP